MALIRKGSLSLVVSFASVGIGALVAPALGSVFFIPATIAGISYLGLVLFNDRLIEKSRTFAGLGKNDSLTSTILWFAAVEFGHLGWILLGIAILASGATSMSNQWQLGLVNYVEPVLYCAALAAFLIKPRWWNIAPLVLEHLAAPVLSYGDLAALRSSQGLEGNLYLRAYGVHTFFHLLATLGLLRYCFLRHAAGKSTPFAASSADPGSPVTLPAASVSHTAVPVALSAPTAVDSDTARRPGPSSSIGRGEKIGFRVLILAWALSGCTLMLGAYWSYQGESLLAKGHAASLSNDFKREQCLKSLESQLAECQGSVEDRAYCVSVLKNNCRHDYFVELVSMYYDSGWSLKRQSETAFQVALALFVLSAILFYAVRWAVTGKLKPLWPLEK